MIGPRSAPSFSSWHGTSSSAVARWGRESLAQGFPRLQSADRAGIARPGGRRRRLPRGARRPPDQLRRRRPARSRSAAHRPSWTALVGRSVEAPAARQVPDRPSRPRPDRVQPDAHGPLPARGAGHRRCRRRRRSCSGSARGPARHVTPRAGRAGALAARRRRAGRGPLSRPDPDGQGLRAAGGCDSAGRRASTATSAPTPTIRASRWRSGESGSAGIPASSRTCSGTRGSSRASATPTATRSSTRRGSCRSASDRRLGGRRGRRPVRGDSDDARHAIDELRGGFRPHSRSRPATGSRSTTRAASLARAAARGSARSSPAASSHLLSRLPALTDPSRPVTGSSGPGRSCSVEVLRPLSFRMRGRGRPELRGDPDQGVAAS